MEPCDLFQFCVNPHSRRYTVHGSNTYFVISLAEELEFLCFFVHEHSIQVPGFCSTDLNSFVSPAHYLSSAYVCWKNHPNLTALSHGKFKCDICLYHQNTTSIYLTILHQKDFRTNWSTQIIPKTYNILQIKTPSFNSSDTYPQMSAFLPTVEQHSWWHDHWSLRKLPHLQQIDKSLLLTV